jgi:hypothetical protein
MHVLSRALALAIGLALPAAAQQPITIFGNSAPLNPIDDGLSVTIGVKFWSTQAGTISGIRFYRAVPNPNGYTAKLYTAGGILLGSVTLPPDTDPTPGWRVANFASPIPIAANTTYISSYFSNIGRGAWDEFGLTMGVTNGPLTAPASSAVGGNGVYRYNNRFPNNSNNASNFWVDVLFNPTVPTPYLILSLNPPNPGIADNAPIGTLLAEIVTTMSDGSPFTGSLAFSQPYSNDGGVCAIQGRQVILGQRAALGASVQNCTITATQ